MHNIIHWGNNIKKKRHKNCSHDSILNYNYQNTTKNTHLFFLSHFHQKKRKRENKILTQNKNSIFDISTLVSKIPSIPFLFTTNPRGIQNIYILQIIWWQRCMKQNEGRKKLKKEEKKREREKSNSRKSSRVAFRKVGEPSSPLCTRGVFWTLRGGSFSKKTENARESGRPRQN